LAGRIKSKITIKKTWEREERRRKAPGEERECGDQERRERNRRVAANTSRRFRTIQKDGDLPCLRNKSLPERLLGVEEK
jgi:hypothetical protein